MISRATLPFTLPAWERDATGLTDRAFLDVLGQCVSAAIVAWLFLELIIAAAATPVISALAAFALGFTIAYLLEWTGELLRQTFVYAGTWRYGGIA